MKKSMATLADSSLLTIKKTLGEGLWLLTVLVFSRLIPHWPNLTALGAIVVVAPLWGQHNSLSFWIPVVGMLISDLILGFHSTMFFVYGTIFSFAWVLQSKSPKERAPLKGSNLMRRAILWSLIFYFTSNIGAWIDSPFYVKDFRGLVQCLYNGLPYLGYEFVGTSVYLFAIVLGYKLLKLNPEISIPEGAH